MKLVEAIRGIVSCSDACEALGLPRASYYREQTRRLAADREPKLRTHPRALTAEQTQQVVGLLNDDRFANLAIPQVWAILLDEGQYVCSRSTMYRILRKRGEVRERRNQLTRPNYIKPELLANAPNQVWSWDITKLRGPQKWTYYYLYVVLDIYSRYVVGWMLARCESAALAKRLWHETIEKYSIAPGQLIAHSDRGAPMTAKAFGLLLTDLGVTQSFNRPHVSNDNPFSEAQFKTLKYRPEYPDRFGSQEHAHAYSHGLLDWYNNSHRHSGLGWMTPADVHFGRASAVRGERARILASAYERHPERFVRRPPTPPALPAAVWIDPPANAQALP